MSSQAVSDFLTKQLFIERNIVTYGTLSRALSLHVHTAKNELAKYHTSATSESQSSATFLISGQVPPRTRPQDDDSMDLSQVEPDEKRIDSEGYELDNEEDIPQLKTVLVAEDGLESAKSKFSRIHNVFIYSLSPSPIRDAGLLCRPPDFVRQISKAKSELETALALGRIVGPHVQMRAGVKLNNDPAAVASSSKAVLAVKPAPAKGELKLKEDSKAKVKEERDERSTLGKEKVNTTENAPAEKTKTSGKLDWSRAKSKDTKKAELKEAEPQEKVKLLERATTSTTSKTSERPIVKKVLEEKLKPAQRGVKRKSTSAILSDSDEDAGSSSGIRSRPPSKTKASSSKKQSVIYSDAEDDQPPPSRPSSRHPSRLKRKSSSEFASVADSETERSLMAMMDVDDELVTRVSRASVSARKEEEEEAEEESDHQDIEMVDDYDLEPKPKPRKKKVKKDVPVGRNGLKKKRVEKSRMKVDEKGYMITEDYSSYESVEEEEEPKEPVPKGKKKAEKPEKAEAAESHAAPAAGFSNAGIKPSLKVPAKTTARGAKAGGSKKGSIANFFGPPAAKK